MRIAAVPVIVAVAALLPLCAPDVLVAQVTKKLNRREIEKLVAEAEKQAAAGQFAEARQQLMPVVQQDPTNAPVALKLARICESVPDWDCAGTAYQLAVSNAAGPDKADAHTGLAAVHLRRGRYTDAAENARAALVLNPSIVSAQLTLATSLVRQGSADALPAAQKAVEIAATNPDAHMALAEALAGANRNAEAETSLRKVLELNPQTAGAHARLSELLLLKDDFDGAIASADTALKLNKDMSQLYSVRGRAHVANANDDQGISDLQHAVTVKPDDAAAHLALAQTYQRRKQFDPAITHYKIAAAHERQMGDASLGLADTLVSKRDFAGAREPVQKAASGLPQSGRAQYLLGMVHEQQQEFDAAVKTFERAAALDPKLAAAHYGAGRVLREHMKDPARAVPHLEKAAALEPNDASVLSEYGVALYEVKQPDRALEILQRATASADFKSPMGLTVLGLTLKDKTRFADALPHFEKAIELAPKWWLPHWGAAWSHFALFKKGCPCGDADKQRMQKLKSHYDSMVSLDGKDAGLQARVDALLKGLKIQ